VASLVKIAQCSPGLNVHAPSDGPCIYGSTTIIIDGNVMRQKGATTHKGKKVFELMEQRARSLDTALGVDELHNCHRWPEVGGALRPPSRQARSSPWPRPMPRGRVPDIKKRQSSGAANTKTWPCMIAVDVHAGKWVWIPD
jgi:hypothetical protein